MFYKKWLVFVVLFLFMGGIQYAYGQPGEATHKDSAVGGPPSDYVSKMQAFARSAAEQSAAEFNADKAAIAQYQILEEVKNTIQQAKIYLKSGIDTVGSRKELEQIEKDIIIAGDGVFTNIGTAQTFRNLFTTSKILSELLRKASSRRDRIDIHKKKLSNFRYQFDSLLNSPALFKFPTDSVALSKYLQQLRLIAHETHPVDTSLKLVTNNIQSDLARINFLIFRIQTNQEEIELFQKELATNTYKKEFGNIWEKAGFYRPFKQIISYSWQKEILILSFYVQNNSGKLFILILFAAAIFIYLRSLKRIYIEAEILASDFEGQLVLRYPMLSSLLIVINLLQFIFTATPFIVSVFFWTISIICLTIIFNGVISRFWMRFWLILIFLFLNAAAGNLLLQASRIERWLMLVCSLGTVLFGTIVLIKGHRKELKERWILYSIALMVLLELAAAFANVLGRYNLGKTLLITGLLNVVIAILFLWTVRLINEGLFLAFNVYKKQDRKLFYVNFKKVGKRVPSLFYVLLVIGWIVLLGKNFPSYEYTINPFKLFFTQERTLGNYTFSLVNVLLFCTIIAVSTLVSRIISFFASDMHFTPDKGNTPAGDVRGIGSWLLLVRIAILSAGLFLALAASGIPIEKVTIVIGALGVGIGFGLQTLVNNLVSGLIIAFEKPVNVGDIVDVDGQTGTMKSIGFRSSVIATSDGADLIMPNGQLLDSHLVNWSLGGNQKRMTLIVAVSYDTDLDEAKLLIAKLIAAEEKIAKHPGPIIQYEQFNNNGIDLKIHFWSKHMNDMLETKSDLIIGISKMFAENGITIPTPKQDIFLHQPAEKNKSED